MMAEEFWSKEKLKKARAQVQREIDLNKRMLGGIPLDLPKQIFK